jgi:hypothetical protein
MNALGLPKQGTGASQGGCNIAISLNSAGSKFRFRHENAKNTRWFAMLRPGFIAWLEQASQTRLSQNR